ncbi:MAG TPA: FlgD immunoglobulin-like domain containing protein, partial [Glycomyces sp.]|nr:FlgD immunoglobulin-like domain containing protein [Glycomyces sp.]
DRHAFLRMLVAQLSNQDPMNPQQGHEFAAQLAQFSSVEQLSTIGETLSVHTQLLAQLSAGLNASALQQSEMAAMLTQRGDLAAASGLIGQTIEANGNHVVWDGTGRAEFGLELAEPAAHTQVVIRDEDGNVVRTLDLGHLGAGRHVPTWDGLDERGRPVEPGAYTFEVKATDPAGERIEATPFTRGRVDRITIEADGITLWIGTLAVAMSDLRGLAT